MQNVIRMTYDVALCHPGEITKIWSLSHLDDLAIPSISPEWLIVDASCHPDDLPGVGISSGWVTANSLCHQDDILFHFMSSGWLNWGWFLIRMSYGNVIMSSGWDTLPFLSHPDEIANFDFPQHAVALQRFRIYTIKQMRNVIQKYRCLTDAHMRHTQTHTHTHTNVLFHIPCFCLWMFFMKGSPKCVILENSVPDYHIMTHQWKCHSWVHRKQSSRSSLDVAKGWIVRTRHPKN